jgi:hypothetical protein
MTEGKGKNVQEAFDNADSAARYEYGNGGYTGSIAEKHGYVEFPAIEGVTPEELAGFLVDWNPDQEEGDKTQLMVQVTYTRGVRMRATEVATRSIPFGTKPPAEPSPVQWGGSRFDVSQAQITSANKWKAKVEKPSEWAVKGNEARKTVLAKVPRHTLKRMWQVYDDKWGPAVAIRTGPDTWTFMGWAST